MAHQRQTHGLVIGGANRRAEADKLAKGVALLVPRALKAASWPRHRPDRATAHATAQTACPSRPAGGGTARRLSLRCAAAGPALRSRTPPRRRP